MGYILNFQNNSNNMKNEIIRKITSLTIMTIMFAGGMTLAIPGFLPDSAIPIQAFAENESTTVGMLTVSSTEIQGGQVLAVTINDPAISNPLIPQARPTMDFNSNTLNFHQAIDGSWVAYVVDQSTALDADSASIDYGTSCTTTVAGSSSAFTDSNKS